MDRRKAIRNILLVVGATAVAGGGYEWHHISKRPDLAGLEKYKGLLPELAETIIPATNTPGAREAQVGDFIYKMVIDCADKKSQNKFLYGLQDLEEHCHSKYGHSFMQCTVKQREETLLHFEQAGKRHAGIIGKIQHKFMGDSFFETLKNYTVIGYATSMQGATQGFAYDYIPSTFEAAVPLKPGQRSWATK